MLLSVCYRFCCDNSNYFISTNAIQDPIKIITSNLCSADGFNNHDIRNIIKVFLCIGILITWQILRIINSPIRIHERSSLSRNPKFRECD